MQQLFPEGYFFMNLLYGLSWAEYGKLSKDNDEIFARAVNESRWALDNLESEKGSAVLDRYLNPPYGAFYNSWCNYLRAKRMEAFEGKTPESEKVTFFEKSAQLAAAFDSSGTPFLQSYNGYSWPADAMPGIASLQIHDKLFEKRFQSAISDWLKKIKERLDPETGLISHSTDFISGETLEGARGSSQSLMNLVLIDIDTTFAKEQYSLYQKHFASSVLGLPMIREYPKGKTGFGDIDSGPVIFGAGFAASVVGLGTANRYGDEQLSNALRNTIETVGFPYSFSKKKRYLFGVLPVGDAFLLWAKLQTPEKLSGISKTEMKGWRLKFHLASAVLMFVLCLPFVFKKIRSKK